MADRLPARTLPLLFLGTAHASLALAFLLAGLWPQAVAGFFYHSWLIGLVHLVTLGWITFSIVGAFYIVGPLALQTEMPARHLDYAAYAFAVVGLAGMVAHFWIQEYGGMAWSAGTIAMGILYMTVRIVDAVRSAAPAGKRGDTTRRIRSRRVRAPGRGSFRRNSRRRGTRRAARGCRRLGRRSRP